MTELSAVRSGLIAQFRTLAATTEGIDLAAYQAAGTDPLEPVIGLGAPDARVGFFGRDPGREEVRWGEPFIGAGGRLVRRALHQQLHGLPLPDFEASRAVGRDFFWANTVPYKPVGNKAWSTRVKQRFHAPMCGVLLQLWQGRDIITLGREAFLWFGIGQPRVVRDALDAFWASEQRFGDAFELTLGDPSGVARSLRLHPLPHPSPLNATWYGRFPGLLTQRLQQLDVRPGQLRL